MTEFFLFAVVGAIAVIAAVAMLLSSNAVHAALYLVVTMACIAFLFLLLNAPFLAMIQITVYAGAIMVLFLFVIMLLGSDNQGETSEPGDSKPRFRWFTPLALILGLVLLLVVGLSVGTAAQQQSTFQPVSSGLAQLRVVNAAADAETLSIQIGGETAFSEFAYGDDTGYFDIIPGDNVVVFTAADGASVTQPISLQVDSVGTLIVFSDNTGLRAGFAAENLDTVDENRSGRLVVFNAYPEATAISLVDYGSEFVEDDTRIIIENLGLGVASVPFAVEEGAVEWQFVQAENVGERIAPLTGFEVERNVSGLLILTQEQFADGSTDGVLRAATLKLLEPARPSFGGPYAIGFLLFTDYLLPFQLLALLLLAAMIGAIILTHRQLTTPVNRIGVRRRVSRPLVNVIAAQVGHDVTDDDAKRQPADDFEAESEAVGN